MSESYNKVQQNYMVAKALADTLEEQVNKIERDYIAAHNIKNEDGTVPEFSWMIDDEAVFEKMLADIGEELEAVGHCEARKLLHDAEDELIRFGLNTLPAKHADVKAIMENACFGLNGDYVHLDARAKMIALTLKLDVRTLHGR